MKQIKQIHQTLELNLNRLQKTIDDLREVAGGHYDLTEEEKSFKLGELTCMLNINLEDLKLDLDELGREISKRDVAYSTPTEDKETAKPEAPNSIESKLKKTLKDTFEEKLKAIIKEREEGKGRSWVYTYSKPDYNLDNQNSTGNPNKHTSYTTSGNAPGLRDYLTANPPKEFTTGYSDVGLNEYDFEIIQTISDLGTDPTQRLSIILDNLSGGGGFFTSPQKTRKSFQTLIKVSKNGFNRLENKINANRSRTYGFGSLTFIKEESGTLIFNHLGLGRVVVCAYPNLELLEDSKFIETGETGIKNEHPMAGEANLEISIIKRLELSSANTYKGLIKNLEDEITAALAKSFIPKYAPKYLPDFFEVGFELSTKDYEDFQKKCNHGINSLKGYFLDSDGRSCPFFVKNETTTLLKVDNGVATITKGTY